MPDTRRTAPPRAVSAALRLLTLLAILRGLTAAPAHAATHTPRAPFKVLALYSGTWDAAHISFVHEANDWFPKQAALNGFTYTASNNWNLLADGGVNGYQVVLFLDDLPQTAGSATPPGRNLDSYRAMPIGLAFQPSPRRGG